MRRAPSAAPVSVGRGAAAPRLAIRRTPPRAAHAVAWRRTAATAGACARARPQNARTRAAGSEWPVDWARRRWRRTIPQPIYTLLVIYLSRHIFRWRAAVAKTRIIARIG